MKYTYNPFWEEAEDLSDEEKLFQEAYEIGYSKGFSDGCKKSKKIAVLEHEIDNLNNLLNSQLRLLKKYETP